MQKFIAILLLSVTPHLLGQQSGYWDKERATSKEVSVSAGKRVLLKTDELPVGTTEIVYRITLLDQNQQIANSLVSVLKAIPDPTGISQGSAGAVLILSKISGDDKCKYAVFTDKERAQIYKETGESKNACLYQDHAVNKDARRLSLNASTCLKSNVMWFGFESSNWIMNQRIVLEVVPWIDNKASRGWNIENRKSIVSICQTTDLAKKLPDNSDYCVCVLEKIQNRYHFSEYQSLVAAEKTKAFKDAGNQCYTETGVAMAISNNRRAEALLLASQGKYPQAITKLQLIFEEEDPKVSDYNALAEDYLFTRQFDKALTLLKQAEKRDPSELQTQLNMAHAYLLKNNFSQAKTIYKKYRLQNVNNFQSWNDKIKSDFAAFEKAGLPSEDFKRILKAIE